METIEAKKNCSRWLVSFFLQLGWTWVHSCNQFQLVSGVCTRLCQDLCKVICILQLSWNFGSKHLLY